MINDILNEMIKRGFVDEYGDINDCNDNEDDFDTVFGQIAESMGLEYAIDSDHVFDSPGYDIYCKAIAVANEDCLDNALLTFTRC
jgi:hypothetical protein